jgi:hypothetical protein
MPDLLFRNSISIIIIIIIVIVIYILLDWEESLLAD